MRLSTGDAVADHAKELREVALGQIGMRAAVAASLGMVDPAHLNARIEQVPIGNLVGGNDASRLDPLSRKVHAMGVPALLQRLGDAAGA